MKRSRSTQSIAKRLRFRATEYPARGRMHMLLEGKNAVVYEGGGKVGGAVARAFASGGARVFPGVYVGDSGSRARRSKLSQSSLRLRSGRTASA
jgi:hypothetical protein